jgi:hypothetical protein
MQIFKHFHPYFLKDRGEFLTTRCQLIMKFSQLLAWCGKFLRGITMTRAPSRKVSR